MGLNLMSNGKGILVLLVFGMVFLIGGSISYVFGNSLTGEIHDVYVGTGVFSIILGIIFIAIMFVFLLGESIGGSSSGL